MTRQDEGEVERVRKAGDTLRHLREDVQGLDQREVSKRTGGRIIAQQLSNIEQGKVARPSMRDLCILGALYGLTPNQMAKLYGYLDDRTASLLEDRRLLRIIGLLSRMDEEHRDRLLRSMEVNAVVEATQAALPDDAFDEGQPGE